MPEGLLLGGAKAAAHSRCQPELGTHLRLEVLFHAQSGGWQHLVGFLVAHVFKASHRERKSPVQVD